MSEVPFADLLSMPLRSGFTIPKEQRGSGIKMLNMGELFKYPRLSNVDMVRVSKPSGTAERVLLKRDDLMFARRSLTLEGAGVCSIVHELEDDTTWESSIIRARLDPRLADARYYFYYFRSPQGRHAMETIVEQVAAAGIRVSELSKFRVPMPHLHEQRAIAEVLGALDDKIGANSQLAQSARQKAVLHTSQMPLSAKLEDIAELHKRTTVPERMEVDLVRHFSLPAFDAGKGAELVDPKEIKSSKFLIEAPSVLVSKLNPRFPRVWDIPTLAAEPSVASTEFLVLHPLREESVEVLWAILSRQSFSAELASNVAGTSGSHQRVKPATVMSAAVVNPRELQSRLKELIKSHLQIAASHHQESSTLEELRDALLPQLMSGKLRVRDAEKIVSDTV